MGDVRAYLGMKRGCQDEKGAEIHTETCPRDLLANANRLSSRTWPTGSAKSKLFLPFRGARDKVPVRALLIAPRGTAEGKKRRGKRANHYQHLTSTAPNLHNLKPRHKIAVDARKA